VFIADEPELSLHVEWQEKLVPIILDLCPEAQILFATHSPDIVNGFQKNVFSMEGFTD
jgi:predicted ATPase